MDVKFKKTISPKDLHIVWKEDPRYWNMSKDEAELLQVCWLEVTGSVPGLNPKKKYKVGFEVKMTPDAFGWKTCPIYVLAKMGKEGAYKFQKVSLAGLASDTPHIIPDPEKTPLEVGGEDKPVSSDGEIHFGLYEVWSGMWKGGLQICNAFVEEV